MLETVEFNPFSSEFRADPYPFYHRLRTEDPVYWSPLGFWVLTRYADVMAVLRDPRFGQKGLEETLLEQFGAGPVQQLYSKFMLFLDPPDHTRLRVLVSKAFTPRVVEGLRPHIQKIVDQLLDAVQGAGAMDIMADLAYPLPVVVICEMLGVPAQDRDQFRPWTSDLAHTLDPYMTPPPELVERGNKTAGAVMDYFRRLIAERRKNLQEDLLSALIAAEEEGDRLSEDELLATCVLLFFAGFETTTNLTGNGTLALLCHPEELRKLKEDPSLIQSAVEELLRYDSPVQMTGRTAKEDIEVGGKTMQKGQEVLTLLGAANRDPAQFPDPDRLDITRSPNRHLAFGHGIHSCLGAPLARVEGQIAIGTLLRRLPGLRRQTDTPEWRETISLRGLQALPVVF